MIFEGFVSRDKIMLSKAYTTYVRPLLEYCSQIWSPTYVTDIVRIEKVQKYFTRRIPSLSNLSCKQRLQSLKLNTLELRRLYFNMRMVYKIILGLINVAFYDLFTFLPYRSTRGHVYKLNCSKSNLNVRSHFFSQRCITAWNSLSNDIVTSPSLSAFNSKLYNVNFEKFLIIYVFTYQHMYYYQLLYYTNIVLHGCTYFYCNVLLF